MLSLLYQHLKLNLREGILQLYSEVSLEQKLEDCSQKFYCYIKTLVKRLYQLYHLLGSYGGY